MRIGDVGGTGFSFIIVTCAVLLPTLLALHYGWLNDDALNYLTLAEHAAAGKNFSLRPSWGDPYWAVFPVGYPAVIAAFKLFFGGSAFTASKLLNGIFLLGSILIAARWLRLPLLLCASLFLNAWMLEIASYSWSENAFIFAELLALAYLTHFLSTGSKTAFIGTLLGLMMAVFSRYIGGFLLAGYALAVLLQVKHSPCGRVLLAGGSVVLCAALFAAYLHLNSQLTGFPTGMARIPAPEPLWLLGEQFVQELLFSLWMLVPPLLLLLTSGARPVRLRLAEYRDLWSPLLLGGCYLIILFALRATSRFEQFSFRLMTPGMLLLYLALLSAMYRRWLPQGLAVSKKSAAVFLGAFLLNLSVVYQDFFVHPELVVTQSADAAWAKYRHQYGAMPEGTVIISGAYDNPTMGWHVISSIFSSDRILYAVADNYPLTLEEYRAYLGRLRYKGARPAQYLFDFHEFGTVEQLHKAMQARSLDPALMGWIEQHFLPYRYVLCLEC